MKRRRNQQHQDTKVWRDPNVVAHRRGAAAAQRLADDRPASVSDDIGSEDVARAEAASPSNGASRRRAGARIVAANAPVDPREREREYLLDRLLNAEGRPSISSATAAYLEANFELPPDEGVWLQLLEHNDEEVVVRAINTLTDLYEEEVPERPAVLDSRLRRIEEFADESGTQRAAGELRRLLATL